MREGKHFCVHGQNVLSPRLALGTAGDPRTAQPGARGMLPELWLRQALPPGTSSSPGKEGDSLDPPPQILRTSCTLGASLLTPGD